MGQKSFMKAAACQKKKEKKKKSVQQALKFGVDLLYKPPFLALWAAHHPTQTKDEYPLGIGCCIPLPFYDLAGQYNIQENICFGVTLDPI